MSIFGKIFGTGAGEILKPVSDILDNVITNKEEKIKAQAELEKVLNDYMIQKEQMANAAVEMYLKDTQDARSLQKVAIGSEDKFVRRFIYYLALVVLIAALAMMALILTGEIPSENKEFAYMIMGSLTTSVATILAYFYGSTRGSDSKNEVIRNLSKSENPVTSN